jgi:plasmid stabilization system protein ParE
MRIRIVASAARDLDEGYDFYEAREAGAGEYFKSTLRAEIEGLKFSAGIHPIKHRDYHRALSHVFPFAIYYAKTQDEVIVYAVVDCRRDPAWIRRRLEE